MIAVIKISNVLTSGEFCIVENIEKAKEVIQQEYSKEIKTCLNSYIDPDFTYAFVEKEHSIIELMLGRQIKHIIHS